MMSLRSGHVLYPYIHRVHSWLCNWC